MAHEEGLVNDDYHERRSRIENRGVLLSSVTPGEDKDRPLAGGPSVIRRKSDEHVQCFPIYEIDRATKKKTLPEEVKVDFYIKILSRVQIFVVTKCLDPRKPSDKEMAEYYVQISNNAQNQKNNKRAAKEVGFCGKLL